MRENNLQQTGHDVKSRICEQPAQNKCKNDECLNILERYMTQNTGQVYGLHMNRAKDNIDNQRFVK